MTVSPREGLRGGSVGQTSGPRLSVSTATLLVIANMVGTGVFTTLGFQARAFDSPFVILSLWIVGGVGALAGALCYAELGAALPRSGGEYHFLSRIFHPSLGFLSAWVSLTVGFSAPVALAAMAFSAYLFRSVPGLNTMAVAVLLVVSVSAVHALGIRSGSWFQAFSTVLKLVLLLGLVCLGMFDPQGQPLDLVPDASDVRALWSSAFAVALVYASYAYSGWNAAAYVTGEMRMPGRDLPRALWFGTLSVVVLYVLVNAAFLRAAPLSELSGQVEVGYWVGRNLLGESGGRIVGGMIALSLVSTVSAMTWAGPRVIQAVGEDYRLFRVFGFRNAGGGPVPAICLQLAIVLVLILTSSFERVMTYLGFTLGLSTFLTVAGLFVLRIREPDLPRPSRVWGYPVTPLLFLAINAWMLAWILVDRPVESLAGLATLAAGLFVYFWIDRQGQEPLETPASGLPAGRNGHG